jgi:hypothetical protein
VSGVTPQRKLPGLARAKQVLFGTARVYAFYILGGGDRPEQIAGSPVTANFFRTLGVKPILGRTFLGNEDGLEDTSAAAEVCIISYRLWQERFAGDPKVLGRALLLDQVPYTIVGVMPADFWFLAHKAQVWVPISLNRSNREYRYLTVVARRRASLTQSSADLVALARALSRPSRGGKNSLPRSPPPRGSFAALCCSAPSLTPREV